MRSDRCRERIWSRSARRDRRRRRNRTIRADCRSMRPGSPDATYLWQAPPVRSKQKLPSWTLPRFHMLFCDIQSRDTDQVDKQDARRIAAAVAVDEAMSREIALAPARMWPCCAHRLRREIVVLKT